VIPFAERPISTLKGIGPQVAEKLHKLNLYTLQDLVFHLPLRYQDRTRITPIGALQLHHDVVVEGEVRVADLSFTGRAFGKRRSLVCRIQDGTGTLTLRFFHFTTAQKNQMKPGVRLRCYGETRRGASGLELYHPEYQIITPHTTESETRLSLQTSLTPVYPATEGVTQPRLRNVIAQALEKLSETSLQDLLPPQQVSLAAALKWLHHPPATADLHPLQEGEHPYQQMLAQEELVAHHLSLLQLRQTIKKRSAYSLPEVPTWEKRFLESLPFALTAAQQRVIRDIRADLSKPEPMLRLLQGDVGSGKTLVAALAALQVIAQGKQVALMAPTEILAEQHFANLQRWFSPLNISLAWLTGSLKAKERQQQLQRIGNGEALLVVGTHALFQDGVEYHDLAFVIIDEQHRFGVHQRLALSEKGSKTAREPHQLTMTATPIPRTLAMSVYADMDYSVIDELPPGRTPVNTVLIDNQRREQVVERVRVACQQGAQAYWVCTLIEESKDLENGDKLECEAAETTAQNLAIALPGIRVGLVHGRLKAAEKARIMAQFKAGEIQLLVATTVIEVGVDVPNASLMIIENPERLGLSQLHQLRGRVGRGSAESHCVLLYSSPLSGLGKERLGVMRETSDGFVIAEKDLQLRGPGELLGTRQTGDISFHIADLQRDAHLLPQVKVIAQKLLHEHPEHVAPLIQRWLGKNQQYGRV